MEERERRGIGIGIVAMVGIVTASNVLVQYPINDWLTWGAFSYPVSFLVTDVTNRALGARRTRLVVYAGFVVAVALSIVFATPRIALASGSAFLAAQLLDIVIFDRLRQAAWWRAPFVSSLISSALDTLLFFGLAFAGTEVPWITLGFGDYAVKVGLAVLMLLPYWSLRTAIAARFS